MHSLAQIFSERPEVHRAYLAHVPHSMDEKAFWTLYFQQQYKRMARRYGPAASMPPPPCRRWGCGSSALVGCADWMGIGEH